MLYADNRTCRVCTEAGCPEEDVRTDGFRTVFQQIADGPDSLGSVLLLASLMSQGINQYLFADYFKNTAALSVYSLLMLPCVLVLSAVSTKLAVKYGKKECSLIGMFISAGLYFIIGVLHVKNVGCSSDWHSLP